MRVTIRQAAGYLGVPESSVRRWMKDGGFPTHRVGDRVFFDAIELWEWAVRNGVSVSRRLLDDARHDSGSLPSLAQLVRDGGITYDLPGENRHEVLHQIVARLPLPPGIDREFLTQVLEAREALGSTGVGDGIAIPHVRNPIVLHVDKPIVALAFLKEPVEFNALDGLPVHSMFTVITPDISTHLAILGRLALVLRGRQLRTLLRQRAAESEILDQLEVLEAQNTSAFRVPGSSG